MQQGTEEWLAARAGSVGASSISDVLAKGKGVTRRNLLCRLAVERLTGTPTATYTNAAMQWGVETEAQARAAYEWKHNASVEEVGLILHPSIEGSHASPDGLVGKGGMLEIKCPQAPQHIATLLGEAIDNSYYLQMQWQMACAERTWVDWVSYNPTFPLELQMVVKRVKRDQAAIDLLEREVIIFLGEVDAMVSELRRLM
jgi:putative phage-type endonuclease